MNEKKFFFTIYEVTIKNEVNIGVFDTVKELLECLKNNYNINTSKSSISQHLNNEEVSDILFYGKFKVFKFGCNDDELIKEEIHE